MFLILFITYKKIFVSGRNQILKRMRIATVVTVFALTMSGCSINFESPKEQTREPAQQQQQQAQNQDQNTQNQNQQQPPANKNEVGIEKTVGNFKVKVNSVQVHKNDPISKTTNGQWIILNLRVTNTSDQPESLQGKVFLKNANGQEAYPGSTPTEVIKDKNINYNEWKIDRNSYYDDGVLAFDISDGAPYTLTIEDNGQTQTWTIKE